MAKFTTFKGYTGDKPQPPKIPKPEVPPEPMIVTVQEGVPVVYPNCVAPAVRVVHPVNPNAPAKNMGLVMFYIPPHAVLEPGSHETEETYVILEGAGTMTFGSGPRPVKKGDFVYLPSWCLHGIENTGTEMLIVLICTSPPNP
ncbi:MAG: cupin domain-containing protein [Planctomycetaceae bacterium]